jgi:hypothetical protein
VIDEGDRISGLWLLSEPVPVPEEVERAQRRLAGALGGPYVYPRDLLLAVPGTWALHLHPVDADVLILPNEPVRRTMLQSPQ